MVLLRELRDTRKEEQPILLQPRLLRLHPRFPSNARLNGDDRETRISYDIVNINARATIRTHVRCVYNVAQLRAHIIADI